MHVYVSIRAETNVFDLFVYSLGYTSIRIPGEYSDIQ